MELIYKLPNITAIGFSICGNSIFALTESQGMSRLLQLHIAEPGEKAPTDLCMWQCARCATDNHYKFKTCYACHLPMPRCDTTPKGLRRLTISHHTDLLSLRRQNVAMVVDPITGVPLLGLEDGVAGAWPKDNTWRLIMLSHQRVNKCMCWDRRHDILVADRSSQLVLFNVLL